MANGCCVPRKNATAPSARNAGEDDVGAPRPFAEQARRERQDPQRRRRLQEDGVGRGGELVGVDEEQQRRRQHQTGDDAILAWDDGARPCRKTSSAERRDPRAEARDLPARERGRLDRGAAGREQESARQDREVGGRGSGSFGQEGVSAVADDSPVRRWLAVAPPRAGANREASGQHVPGRWRPARRWASAATSRVATSSREDPPMHDAPLSLLPLSARPLSPRPVSLAVALGAMLLAPLAAVAQSPQPGAKADGRDHRSGPLAAHRQRRRDPGLPHRRRAARSLERPRVLQRGAGRLQHRAHRRALRLRRRRQPVPGGRVRARRPGQHRALPAERRVLPRAVDRGAAAVRVRHPRRHRRAAPVGAGHRRPAVAAQLGRATRPRHRRRDRRLRPRRRGHLRQRDSSGPATSPPRLHHRPDRGVRLLGVRRAGRTAGHRRRTPARAIRAARCCFDFGSGDVVAGIGSGGLNADCQPDDLPFDTDVFANLAGIAAAAGLDLGDAECGDLPVVGSPGQIQINDSGEITQAGQIVDRQFQVPAGTRSLRVALNAEEGLLINELDLADLTAAERRRWARSSARRTRDGGYEFCDVDNPAAGHLERARRRRLGRRPLPAHHHHPARGGPRPLRARTRRRSASTTGPATAVSKRPSRSTPRRPAASAASATPSSSTRWASPPAASSGSSTARTPRSCSRSSTAAPSTTTAGCSGRPGPTCA